MMPPPTLASQPGPLVSIIIPCYFSREFLAETLQTVFNQTYPNYEIIIVDDGGEQPVRDVVEIFASAKIRYFMIDHVGGNAARNYGILNASGDYIAFLDADDLWMPAKLERQIREMARTGYIWSATDSVRFVSETGRILDRFDDKKRPDNIFHDLLTDNNFLCHSSVVLQKSTLLDLGVLDESLVTAGDLDLWLRVAPENPLAFIPETLCKYRIHASSVSKSTKVQVRWLEFQAIMAKVALNNPDLPPRLIEVSKQKRLRVLFLDYLRLLDFQNARILLGQIRPRPNELLFVLFKMIFLLEDKSLHRLFKMYYNAKKKMFK